MYKTKYKAILHIFTGISNNNNNNNNTTSCLTVHFLTWLFTHVQSNPNTLPLYTHWVRSAMSMATFQIQAVTVNEPATGRGVDLETETLPRVKQHASGL
jgi:hypothetical protein